MSAPERPWSSVPDGIVLAVRLTPRGGRDALEGVARLDDGASVLKARVRAAPSDGAANVALMRLLADALGVAQRDVSLLAGDTARRKRVKIAGDRAVLTAALERICGAT